MRSSRKFFLTGLPRCRSAWFANLLTYGKSWFCYHDIFSHVSTMEDFHKALSVDYDVIGVADPALVLFWKLIWKEYPNATWIIIRRPFIETLASCKNAFEDFDQSYLQFLHTELDALDRQVDAHVFNFHDLNRDAIMQICSLCAVPFTPERVDMLMTMQVQIEPKYLARRIQELSKNPTPLLRSIAA